MVTFSLTPIGREHNSHVHHLTGPRPKPDAKGRRCHYFFPGYDLEYKSIKQRHECPGIALYTRKDHKEEVADYRVRLGGPCLKDPVAGSQLQCTAYRFGIGNS